MSLHTLLFLLSMLLVVAAALVLALRLAEDLGLARRPAWTWGRLGERLGHVAAWLRTRETWWILTLPVVFELVVYALVQTWHNAFVTPGAPLSFWESWELWSRWDGQHYLQIARGGYAATGPEAINIAFLPLWPALMRFASTLTGLGLVHASLLLNLALGPVLFWGLYRLSRLDVPESTAGLVVVTTMLFPLSFVHQAVYTERLYLTLLVWTFYFARTSRWWSAGALSLLLALTKTATVWLWPALAWEHVLFLRDRRWRPTWSTLSLAAIPLGVLVFLWINQRVQGDPFAFLDHLRVKWFKEPSPFWEGIRRVLETGRPNDLQDALTGRVAEAAGVVLALLATLLVALRLRTSYALFMFASTLYFLSTSWLLSTPRYVSVFFPAAILFARWAEPRRAILGITLAAFAVLYVAYSIWFTQGFWVF